MTDFLTARRTRVTEALQLGETLLLLVDQRLSLGGIRIEDTVLGTDGAPLSLTDGISKAL